MKLDNYDLFLFDFDGLLMDTERVHFEAYRQTLAHFDIELNWDMTHYCHVAQTSSQFLQDQLFTTFPKLRSYEWEELYTMKKKRYLSLIEEQEIGFMPGAQEFLENLSRQNVPMAVVTHSPLEQIELIKSKTAALEIIPHWFTREDYKCAKPAPDGYLHAQKALGGQNPIGFEDSLRGLQSLIAAKIPAVLIRPDYYPPLSPEQVHNAHCIDSFHSL